MRLEIRLVAIIIPYYYVGSLIDSIVVAVPCGGHKTMLFPIFK